MMQITSAERLGWRPGLAVIDAGGYLGRLHTITDPHTAWVELLTSPDMALGVELERTGLLGVLRPRAGSFVLEMVGRDEDVVSGDRVITSGIAELRTWRRARREIRAEGLPVGEVDVVSAPSEEIFKRIGYARSPTSGATRSSSSSAWGPSATNRARRADTTLDPRPVPAAGTTLGAT